MNTTNPASNPVIESILKAVDAMPSAATVDVRIGPFWSVVNTTAGAGMASTLRPQAHVHGTVPIADAGMLSERTPVELAGLLRSASTPEAAVGLAAVNALFNPSAPASPATRPWQCSKNGPPAGRWR